MKTKIPVNAILLSLIISLSACSDHNYQDIKIIPTYGAEGIYNLSKSHTLFGSSSLSDHISGISAEDGDLLYVICQEKSDKIFFRYSEAFGDKLNFRSDSLETFKVTLNDKYLSLQLTDSSAWNWLLKQEKEDLENLHSISLSLPITEGQLGELSRVSKLKSSVNLRIEAKNSVSQFEKILELFRPEWLFATIDTNWTISGEIPEGLKNLKTLALNISPESNLNVDQLYSLRNLQNLILEWSPVEGPAIRFDKFRKLKSLSITESNIRNMADLKLPVDLHCLYFMNCDSLENISGLSALRHLRVLGLAGCKNLKNFDPLEELDKLTWFSCPPAIDQAKFDAFISRQSSLKTLEIIKCDSLKNLDIIRSLKNIRSVNLATSQIDPASLIGIKQLELLVLLPDTGVAGETQFGDLRTQMPNTLVVPGKGFCLGSGWIVLIIPLVISGIFIRKYRRVKS